MAFSLSKARYRVQEFQHGMFGLSVFLRLVLSVSKRAVYLIGEPESQNLFPLIHTTQQIRGTHRWLLVQI
jgi:hypothetical protein